MGEHMNASTDDTRKACPACGEILEEGKALLLSAMAIGAAYRCTACRVIYTHDLQFLARMVGEAEESHDAHTDS
jgi:hypothetical protein